MQLFRLQDDFAVCNGEIYGFLPFRERLMEKYALRSHSDCEILLPLYLKYGIEMFKTLDAEFALVTYDGKKDKLIARPAALLRKTAGRAMSYCQRTEEPHGAVFPHFPVSTRMLLDGRGVPLLCRSCILR